MTESEVGTVDPRTTPFDSVKILPSTAVSRLVPGADPNDIVADADIEVEVIGTVEPMITPFDKVYTTPFGSTERLVTALTVLVVVVCAEIDLEVGNEELGLGMAKVDPITTPFE